MVGQTVCLSQADRENREGNQIEHNQPGGKSRALSEPLSLTERCHLLKFALFQNQPSAIAALQGAVWFYVPRSIHLKLR